MLTQNILKFIFSLALGINLVFVYGQETDAKEDAGENKTRTFAFDGIRVGYDVFNFADFYLKPPKTEHTLYGDFFFAPRTMLVGNLGKTWIKREKNDFLYEATGSYIKAGVEYNTFPERTNILSIGGRIGSATMSHQAKNIFIPSRDSIWNDIEEATIGEERINATWLEISLSMHVEIFANLYLGWSIQGKLMMFGPRNNAMVPYEIPGYGNGNKNTAAGFNYYVSYKIPIKFNSHDGE